MSDPFANAAAGTAAADPFGQKPSEIKTSDFPSMDDLDKELLVVQPTKLERVPDKFSNQAGAMKDRVTADVTIIDHVNPANSKTHKDMYISQGALVGQVKGFIETRGMLLGRLRRHSANGTPEQFRNGTPDDIDMMIDAWVKGGAKGAKPQFAWKLADFTEQEKELALQWYRSKNA